jgi:hypothetical protein
MAMNLPTDPTRRINPVRVVTVTLGLVGAGAVAGALVAMTTFAAATLVLGELSNISWRGFLFVGAVGGAFGLTLGPLVAWTLLRKVPLGKAVLFPSLGAAVGSAIGLALSPLTPLAVFVGGVIGMLVPAVWLWLKHRR